MNDAGPPPRYAPQRTLPPYTYVPGRTPHPISDAAGHMFGRPPATATPLDETNWPTHDEYLHAVDLFNHGFYWEAHEGWEAVWHAVGRRGATADLLKGLIKLAAAGVKVLEHRPLGVARHLDRAAQLFSAAFDDPVSRRLGLSRDELEHIGRALAAASSADSPLEPARPLDGARLTLRRD